MSVRLAPARSSMPGFSVRAAYVRMSARAANDNGDLRRHDDALRDALKLFAQYGMRAADEARERAERAFFAGDRPTYQRWLAICRTLDRRLASTASTQLSQGTK